MTAPLSILIVEDSEDDAKLAVRALRKGGYAPSYRRVQTAAALSEALAEGRWDAIISDFNMPGFTGFDALDTFQRAGLDIPFILISGTIGEETAVRAMKAGASDYVMKKNLERLAPAMERELRDAQTRAAHEKALRALRESEERHRLLFEGNPLPMWAFDIETLRFLDVNEVACRSYGYSRDEFLAMTTRDIRPPEDVAVMESSARNGAARRLEPARHLKRDGTIIDVEIAAHEAIFKGRRTRFVCPIDVTDRLRAENRIRKLSQAVAQSPAATVITDTEGRIEYVNPKFSEVSGYAMEEIIGRTPAVVKSGLTPAAVYQHLWATIKSGAQWRGKLQNRRKNGSLYWEDVIISPLKNERGEIVNFVGVKEDITERKHAEEEVLRLNADLELRVAERTAELEAANKELESFSYSVSHDLRAPLRAIEGFTRLLVNEHAVEFTPEAKLLSDRVQSNVRKMAKLIDDLLEFSRMGRAPLARTATPLSEIVSACLATFRDELGERGVEVSLGTLPTSNVDPSLMSNVFQNLLDNAIKYTRPREGALIEIGCELREGETAIFVRDNGVGFDMQYAGKLYGVFQRLHSSSEFEGTGVGLAIVRRIVERHGGHVWAEAKLGEGATFWFSLQ